MQQINQLPTPVPTATDPANFDARADALVAALPDFVDQANLLATEVNQSAQYIVGTYDVVVTAMTPTISSKSITITNLGKTFYVGMTVSLWIPGDTTKRMSGNITAFNAVTRAMTINVTAVAGAAGSVTGWVVAASAPFINPSWIGSIITINAAYGCF